MLNEQVGKRSPFFVSFRKLCMVLGAFEVEFIKQTSTDYDWTQGKEYTFENLPATTFIFWMNTPRTDARWGESTVKRGKMRGEALN